MEGTVQELIDRLTVEHRVVIVGGVAVIAHGMSRHTKDADVWLDPMDSAEKWDLREFADAGDPFSLAIIEGREVP